MCNAPDNQGQTKNWFGIKNYAWADAHQWEARMGAQVKRVRLIALIRWMDNCFAITRPFIDMETPFPLSSYAP